MFNKLCLIFSFIWNFLVERPDPDIQCPFQFIIQVKSRVKLRQLETQ